MRKAFALSAVAAAGLAFGFAAHAEVAPGFYAGLSIGSATIKAEGSDDSDTALKLFGGYTFNENFAVELAYFDGGKMEKTEGPFSISAEVSGINVSAVGSLPLTEAFTAFAKLGLASSDVKVKVRSPFGSGSASDSGTDLSYGIGGSYSFMQNFAVRVEYEAVDVSDADFNMLTIGATYRF